MDRAMCKLPLIYCSAPIAPSVGQVSRLALAMARPSSCQVAPLDVLRVRPPDDAVGEVLAVDASQATYNEAGRIYDLPERVPAILRSPGTQRKLCAIGEDWFRNVLWRHACSSFKRPYCAFDAIVRQNSARFLLPSSSCVRHQ